MLSRASKSPRSDNDNHNSAQLQQFSNDKAETNVKAHNYQAFEKKKASPTVNNKEHKTFNEKSNPRPSGLWCTFQAK